MLFLWLVWSIFTFIQMEWQRWIPLYQTNAIKTLNKALNDKDEEIKDMTARLSETREFLKEREEALQIMKMTYSM